MLSTKEVAGGSTGRPSFSASSVVPANTAAPDPSSSDPAAAFLQLKSCRPATEGLAPLPLATWTVSGAAHPADATSAKSVMSSASRLPARARIVFRSLESSIFGEKHATYRVRQYVLHKNCVHCEILTLKPCQY